MDVLAFSFIMLVTNIAWLVVDWWVLGNKWNWVIRIEINGLDLQMIWEECIIHHAYLYFKYQNKEKQSWEDPILLTTGHMST